MFYTERFVIYTNDLDIGYVSEPLFLQMIYVNFVADYKLRMIKFILHIVN